ncbi:unnamed protein product [Miscanthus lutarioriparius]|uniref:Uncharacterized protein n=1 Tax=Miscanthus lutarioriparius TaxID=422564 RepID=A0A811SKE3_9POAL|nr:unnamed protein product [Miscanthus lutarioriparius]
MTTKPPLTVFISTESENDEIMIMWADQGMESFKRFSMAYPNKPTYIMSFGGNMYATDRVNTETRVIEPVSSIDSLTLFVSHVWCLSINADKFPSIQGSYVYFLEPTIFGSYYYGAVDTTIVHVADNIVVEFAGGYGSLEGFFRPFTLAQVITDSRKSIHYSKSVRNDDAQQVGHLG